MQQIGENRIVANQHQFKFIQLRLNDFDTRTRRDPIAIIIDKAAMVSH